MKDNFDVTTLFDIGGKVAAVTGAGGALAGTMAEGLGALGVKTAVIDIHQENAEKKASLINERGGEAKSFVCNVLDEESIQKCYESIRQEWGVPDFLINGAGGNDARASTVKEFLEKEDLDNDDFLNLFTIKASDFSNVLGLNFTGTFLPTRVFAKGMAENGKGAIINIASMCSITPLTKVVAYSAAKAAVANFTKWLAVHLSHVGVRVNAIAPGFFMTEQLKFLHIDQKTGQLTPRAQKAVNHTPMGRYGEPEDLIGTMVWLLSEGARFVTGVVVPVDGGYSSYSL